MTESLNELISDKGDGRIAPTTLGMTIKDISAL